MCFAVIADYNSTIPTSPQNKERPVKNPVSLSTFVGQTIPLDGDMYKQCEFRQCTLVYSGGELPGFQNCNFYDVTWKFEGAAERTLSFLSLFYHGMGEVGPPIVEKTFADIRKPPEKPGAAGV